MTPVIPCSSYIVAGATFNTRKNSTLRRCCLLKSSNKRTSYAQDFIVPLSASVRLFPRIRTFDLWHNPRSGVVSATGVDVAVEQADSSAADQDSAETLESPSEVQLKEDSSVKSKRARPGRKSEMPPLKNEDLVPGATFTGKVRSVQPFGAFVDIGAFSDGLVHVSQLSDSFVKDVGAVVSVGQEVTVRLLEANPESGRISLTMRRGDSTGPADGDKTSPPRRNTQKSNQNRDGPGKKTTTKFAKGQELEGTVKNLTRAGAFIYLPEGEEGFLPQSEEAGNIMGQTSLEVGQQVNVRVLRISRGQATLTMKEEGDVLSSDLETNVGTVYATSSPFLLAFRKNKEISSFLDNREKEKEADNIVLDSLESVDSAVIEEEPVASSDVLSPEEGDKEAEQVVSDSSESVDSAVIEKESVAGSDVLSPEEGDKEAEKVVSDSLESVDSAVIEQESVMSSDALSPEESVSAVDQVMERATESPEVIEVKSDGETDEPVIDEAEIEAPSAETEASISSPPSVEIEKAEVDFDESIDISSEAPTEGPEDDSEISSSAPISDEKGDPDMNRNSSITTDAQILTPDSDEVTEQIQAPSSQEMAGEESLISEVENPIPNMTPKAAVQNQTPEDVAPDEEKNLGPTPEQDVSITDSNAQTNVLSSAESTVKATISPALVKQLREETGAGMMDCKRALSETEGDITKAQEYLRKKGLASADKKSSRATAEGRIGSYIHDSRIGVLMEVNCETDFVARGDIFKGLVDDLVMQVAACPQVKYLDTEDVPKEMVDKEREIEMQKEDLSSKPEQIRSKIVDGRIRKRLEELALLEQPYIKNDKLVVKDFIKQTIATIGENMKVKRFVRFNLGEGLEKKSQDFAAEVAAQTSAKSVPAPVADQPTAVEAKVNEDKSQKATISAALVKQLREETGAGMMDCKKALSETGGDLEKAQEFLRKKGLSAADKKSGRIAAEGRIGSYIHDSRIGVLIEVNCETDFVGRSEKFKDLVDDLAMQVAAYPKVGYVSVEDIPASIVTKEKELEMQREDILSKPENIREKIVDGRVSKRLGELALLEQPFIKDDSVLVKDLVKQSVAAIGENIKVRRFVRFTLGEANDAKSETE